MRLLTYNVTSREIDERAVPFDGGYEFERAERDGAVTLRCGLCLKTHIILFRKLICYTPLSARQYVVLRDVLHMAESDELVEQRLANGGRGREVE